MGLRDDITNDLIEALSDPDDLGDAARDAVLTKRIHPDKSSGVRLGGSKEDAVTEYPAKLVVLSSFSSFEIASGIPASDVKITVLQKQLGATPVSGDEITVVGRGSFKIVAVGSDGADVTWKLQARKM